MNLKYWRHFLTIADTQNLTRAAEHLRVPQPALSRELRELEASVGSALFSRHPRGVLLTPAGQIFRKRVETILRDIERVPAEVAASNDVLTGSLSLGMPLSMGRLLTAPLVELFREQLPQISLFLRDGISTQIKEGLLSRELDLGVLSTPLIEPQLQLEPLIEEPMVLVSPVRSGFDPARPVSLEQVAKLPLILSRRPNSARIIVEHALEAIGLVPTVVVETNSTLVDELVSRGVAYSVLPSCYVAGLRNDLEYTPIRGLWISWSIARLRALPLAPAAQHMVNLIRELAGKRNDWPLWADRKLRQSLRPKPRGR